MTELLIQFFNWLDSLSPWNALLFSIALVFVLSCLIIFTDWWFATRGRRAANRAATKEFKAELARRAAIRVKHKQTDTWELLSFPIETRRQDDVGVQPTHPWPRTSLPEPKRYPPMPKIAPPKAG
jgi:hypothetical protein